MRTVDLCNLAHPAVPVCRPYVVGVCQPPHVPRARVRTDGQPCRGALRPPPAAQEQGEASLHTPVAEQPHVGAEQDAMPAGRAAQPDGQPWRAQPTAHLGGQSGVTAVPVPRACCGDVGYSCGAVPAHLWLRWCPVPAQVSHWAAPARLGPTIAITDTTAPRLVANVQLARDCSAPEEEAEHGLWGHGHGDTAVGTRPWERHEAQSQGPVQNGSWCPVPNSVVPMVSRGKPDYPWLNNNNNCYYYY